MRRPKVRAIKTIALIIFSISMFLIGSFWFSRFTSINYEDSFALDIGALIAIYLILIPFLLILGYLIYWLSYVYKRRFRRRISQNSGMLTVLFGFINIFVCVYLLVELHNKGKLFSLTGYLKEIYLFITMVLGLGGAFMIALGFRRINKIKRRLPLGTDDKI